MNCNTTENRFGLIRFFLLLLTLFIFSASCSKKVNIRSRIDFNVGWKFYSGDNEQASCVAFDDTTWRSLNLPHDWSIEGEFRKENPTRTNGGALPTGIGWYRKTFRIDRTEKNPGSIYIEASSDGLAKAELHLRTN